jgi:hypothetical protein
MAHFCITQSPGSLADRLKVGGHRSQDLYKFTMTEGLTCKGLGPHVLLGATD